MKGRSRQVWIDRQVVDAVVGKVHETVRDSVVREQDLRQEISTPSIVEEPLQLEESVGVEPCKQAALPMHASKFIHYDAHDAQPVSLQAFVVGKPINRDLAPVEPHYVSGRELPRLLRQGKEGTEVG